MKTIFTALHNDLGAGMDLQPRRKNWLPAVLAGVGLASSVIGGMESSKAAKRAERRQREREAEENAYFNRRYNEDYADTAAGQNLIRRAKDYARENWRKAAGAQVVAGGTDAAAAMSKEAGNRMVGDTLANIAAQDTQRKANVEAQHNAARQQFAQMDMQRETAKAQAIAQASQGASNAMLGAAAALSQDASGTNLNGGGNNSVNIDLITGSNNEAVNEEIRRRASEQFNSFTPASPFGG